MHSIHTTIQYRVSREGFCANFLPLSCEADKLQRAVARLNAVPHGILARCCSCTRVVDANFV